MPAMTRKLIIIRKIKVYFITTVKKISSGYIIVALDYKPIPALNKLMQADNEFKAKMALHSETLPRNQEKKNVLFF